MRVLAASVVLALVLTPARAGTPGPDPRVAAALELVRVWLDAQRAYEQIPGISAGVVYDQDLIWRGGFGFADLEKKTPASASTIYSICSISKLFTSIGVMQLRDAGKLRLDDPVARHLPWFKIRQTAPEGGEQTIEGLLTHASGLPRESDHPYWTGPDFAFPTREQVIERLSLQETLYPTETYFQYSNLGITLAGEVVAAAAGQPYADYVRRNILDPLGLSSTTPEMPDQHRGGRLATGYGALTREGKRPALAFFRVRGILRRRDFGRPLGEWPRDALSTDDGPGQGADQAQEGRRARLPSGPQG